jgi:uncharacterized protein YkwD/outer membrane murein-binding lipoprotein Lpp
MKKLFYFVIFAMTAVTFFHYGGNITKKTGEVAENIKNAPVVEELRKEISTSGTLRLSEESQNAYLTRAGTINFTNQERIKEGLPALKENTLLNKAAQAKVRDMFEKQYFEHISPEGRGPADLAGDVKYEFIAVGENLALGNYKNDSALVEAWMNSPGHKANILSEKFTEIGVAVLRGTFEGKITWLAVQEFGKPTSSCPKVDQSLKDQIDSLKAEVDVLDFQIKAKREELDREDPKTKEEYDRYNEKVAEFNTLIKTYNNKIDILKNSVEIYNSQIKAYNACL